MASLASEVSITQSVEFFSRFGRFGGSMTKLQELLGNDELMEWWVKRLEKRPEFKGLSVSVNAPPYGDMPHLDRYRVRVNRESLPPMSVLLEKYGEDGVAVAGVFSGTNTWRKHPSRIGANDIRTEEVEVFVKHFSKGEIREMGGLKTENIIAWGLKNGFVPADEKEICAIGLNPETHDLQYRFCLAGLGSSVFNGSEKRWNVAILDSCEGHSFITGRWIDCQWDPEDRFVFVRKPAEVGPSSAG